MNHALAAFIVGFRALRLAVLPAEDLQEHPGSHKIMLHSYALRMTVEKCCPLIEKSS